MGSKRRCFCIKSGSFWGLHNLTAASNKSLPSCCSPPAWLLSLKMGSKVTLPLRVNLGERRTRPSLKNLSWRFTFWPLHASLFMLIPIHGIPGMVNVSGQRHTTSGGCEGGTCRWLCGCEAVLRGSGHPRRGLRGGHGPCTAVVQDSSSAWVGSEAWTLCTTREIQHSCHVI